MSARDVERTADGRHVIVGGRRWRATDPSIPENLRAELVAELMDARREIGRLRRVDGAEQGDVAAARRRVDDAKVALGERGAPWWQPAGRDDLRRRIDAAVFALLRHRAGSICPSDVARVAAPSDGSWRDAMQSVRQRGAELAAAGRIEVTQRGRPVDAASAVGPVRWQRGPAFEARPRRRDPTP